jgi:hypothetical protein
MEWIIDHTTKVFYPRVAATQLDFVTNLLRLHPLGTLKAGQYIII